MTRAFRFRAPTAVALCGILSSACIITTSDDTASDTGPGETSSNPPGDTGPGTSTDPTDPTDPTVDPSDTGLPPPEGDCTDNLFADPGFEAGTPNPSWDEESMLFGTPICDASCTDMPGAAPHGGSWWVWFGGLENASDFATVAQQVVIPEGDAAYLTFWLQIRSGSGTGNDVFAITVDDSQVFFVADTDMAEFDGYTQVQVDVTDFADGQSHMFYFDGDIAGVGLTSYFLDDVSLVSCVDEATDSTATAGSSTGAMTTGLDSSGGSDSGTGTGTGTGTTGTGTTGT